MPDAPLPALAERGLSDADRAAIIVELATRYRRADGGLMRAVNALGGAVEHGLSQLPKPAQEQLQKAVRGALEAAYRGAKASDIGPRGPAWLNGALATMSGAGAGALGPVGYAEVPLAVTIMMRAIRDVARGFGYDPDDPEVARVCLTVFAAGGPLDSDDGVDSAFLSARMAASGPALQGLLARVSARLAQTLAQKMGAQTVPILGAIGGGAVNYAFVRYYTEMAHVTFGLMRLAETDDPARIGAAFRRAVDRI